MEPKLKTRYMGLELANPIIVGASKLTASVEGIQKAEAAGAGAVVCASLFEEQIQLEQWKMENDIESISNVDAEIGGFFPSLEHSGPKEYLHWVKKAKASVKIPVIGSLNAVDEGSWVDYAQMIEDTGVDGLELNFFHTPGDFDKSGAEVESDQLRVIEAVKAKIRIPLAVKLSCCYSNPLLFISRIDQLGVRAFVLFNRLFESDIDTDEIRHTTPLNLSSKGDHKLACRYAGLLFKRVKADVCANNGFMSGRDVVRAILSGASAVQVVSTLYRHRHDQIEVMLAEIRQWMTQQNLSDLNAIRGKLAEVNVNDRFIYKRAQYVDLILRSQELLESPAP